MTKSLEYIKSQLQNAKDKEFIGQHKSKVHSLDWSVDGKRLASGSTDHTIRVWSLDALVNNITNSRDILELKGHPSSVDQVSWHPITTDLLASVGGDSILRVWDVRTAQMVKSITLASDTLNMAWSRDGKRLAVGCRDDTLNIIDFGLSKLQVQRKFNQEINEMVWTKNDTEILVARGSGCIELVGSDDLNTKASLPGHTSNCYCLRMDKSGDTFVVGSADSIVSIWDYNELACTRTLCRLNWPIRTLGVNHDGTLIASGSEDPFIDISSIQTGELVHKLPVTAAVNTLAWHPSKLILAYAGDHVDPRTGRGLGSIHLVGI